MRLTEALEHWVADAERMSGNSATLVVVTEEVLAGLADEQATTSPAPVVFVPVPPAGVDNPAQLEMYNRLRWYGLGPEEARAGS